MILFKKIENVGIYKLSEGRVFCFNIFMEEIKTRIFLKENFLENLLKLVSLRGEELMPFDLENKFYF